MKTELLYLTLTIALTGLLWMPYILDRFARWGLINTVGYPDNPPSQSAWAVRLMRAHSNAVENLLVFGLLVLIAQVMGISNEITAVASVVYFWARLTHAVAYTAAIPWIRTLAFIAGFCAQVTFAWQILAA